MTDTFEKLKEQKDQIEARRKRKAKRIFIFEGLHPETAALVAEFAYALAEKLQNAEQKYGYSDDWKQKDWTDECRLKLREHLEKGDPLDVAAYCAFLWFHKEPTK